MNGIIYINDMVTLINQIFGAEEVAVMICFDNRQSRLCSSLARYISQLWRGKIKTLTICA